MKDMLIRALPPICGGSDAPVADVQADSSPAPDAAQPTPAGAQNTDQAAQNGDQQAQQQAKPEQTIPYARFREVIGKNQQLTQAVAQLQGRIQQMEALQQQAQRQGGLTQQQQQDYQTAAQALKDILANDPELKTLLDVVKNGQALMGTQQTVASMREAQLRTMERQGVNRILELADQEALPKDTEFRQGFIKYVESLALSIPQAKERFAAGDLTLLDEAFEKAKPLLAQLKREGQTQLLNTKDKTRQLPPAPRGSAAGPAGLPKLDPNNPRAFESALHKAATALLNEKG